MIAQVASDAGDQIARVALALLVLERTGSAFGAAATFAVAFVPAFFGAALLGPLADRLSRRTLMLGADLGRAVIITVLALVATDTAPLPLLFALLLAAEFLTPVFDAARTATIPTILPEPPLVTAGMGLSRTLHLSNQVIGLLIGGVVVTVLNPRAALLLDALSFVVSFLLLSAMLAPRRALLAGRTTPRALLRDLREGSSMLWADPSRRALIGLAWFLVIAVVAPEGLGLAYSVSVGAEDYWGGALMAAPLAGAALGSLLIARLEPVGQLDRMLPLAALSWTPLLLTGFEPPLPVLAALWFVSGGLQAYFVSIMALTTLLTRDEHRGRVTGIASAGFSVCSVIGLLLAGALADLTSPAFAVTLIAAGGLAVVGVASLLWPTQTLRHDVLGLESY
jgi:MFS family permease